MGPPGRAVAVLLPGLGFSVSLTMVSSNVAGYTKKQLAGAALFTGHCVGNIIGPQTFKSSEVPRYHSAYIAYVYSRLQFLRGVADGGVGCSRGTVLGLL